MSTLAEQLTWKFVFQPFNCHTWCCRPGVISSSPQSRLYSNSGLCSIHQGVVKLNHLQTDTSCWNNSQRTHRNGNPKSYPTWTKTFVYFYHFGKVPFLSFLLCFHWINFFPSARDGVIKLHPCRRTTEILQPWPGSRTPFLPNIDFTPSVYFEWSCLVYCYFYCISDLVLLIKFGLVG